MKHKITSLRRACSDTCARILAIGTVVASAAAFGQEAEPTLEQTVDYMNSKLAVCPAGFAQAITLEDGTTMDVTGHSVGIPGQRRTLIDWLEGSMHRIRFNIADLRLSLSVSELGGDSRQHQIENTFFDIAVFTVRCADVGCIQVIERSEQHDGFDQWSERYLYSGDTATEYHFFICDGGEADRFERALNHALEIGGAQEELF